LTASGAQPAHQHHRLSAGLAVPPNSFPRQRGFDASAQGRRKGLAALPGRRVNRPNVSCARHTRDRFHKAVETGPYAPFLPSDSSSCLPYLFAAKYAGVSGLARSSRPTSAVGDLVALIHPTAPSCARCRAAHAVGWWKVGEDLAREHPPPATAKVLLDRRHEYGTPRRRHYPQAARALRRDCR